VHLVLADYHEAQTLKESRKTLEKYQPDKVGMLLSLTKKTILRCKVVVLGRNI
jgi:hypothetical protein